MRGITGSGVVYRDYFASADLMFPAQVDETLLKQKDYVFGVRRVGAARAWPLGAFDGGGVINDAVGDLPLALVGDVQGRTVRAYERGERRFEIAEDGLRDGAGGLWRVEEDALIGPEGARLPRVAGHIAYWFAWSNYMGGVATLFEE